MIGKRLPTLALATLLAVTASMSALGSPATAAGPGHARAERAQHALNDLHCQAGRPTGTVGRQTRSAIVRFQSRTGLPRTARLDPRTRARLYADDAPRCDRRPVPDRSGSGRRIVVSQAQNWVWLVGPKGGVVAQGGMIDNPRVLHRGTHRVGSYCGRAARIKLNRASSGGLWLDDFVRFASCGIGFHRIPRSQATGRQIHRDWLLGTDMATSHGCIRLSRALAARVWRFATVGTTVRVL